MIVSEKMIDFNSLEREIVEKSREAGRCALRAQLEAWDKMLMESRDPKVYRNNGFRQTTIKTMLGEVTYSRRVYEQRNPEGTKATVYLLDAAMEVNGCGLMSGNLANEIGKAACEGSYRATARAVSEMTGQRVSHTTAWNTVQTLGERVGVLEEQAAELVAKHKSGGRLESPVLFEEQDGIWLKLQGKSRKRYGASHEMKLAIAYDGAKKVGKKRYELTNKVACANFENVGKFINRKEGAIAAVYNVDEIDMRFLNGDGAVWIKQSVTDDTVHFQLDAFHRNKAVLTHVKDPEKRALVWELLYAKRIDDLLDCLEGYMNCLDETIEEEVSEKDDLQILLNYFANNKDGLVPCHRRGLDIPNPPDGKEYRRMGAMESNVFTVLGNRMKDRRACWSIDGGNKLARLLCLRATGKLTDTLERLSALCLPLKYTEEVMIKMTVSKSPKADGKGYEPVHGGAFPALPEYKWLREICKIKDLPM
jgi:hypothetical protein